MTAASTRKGLHRWTIEWRTLDGVRMISRRWAATPEAALADLRAEWVLGSVEYVYRGRRRPAALARAKVKEPTQ